MPGATRILIVEDDAALRLALSDRLSREGYQVQIATDGNQGAALAANRNLDLVVLDVMLPGRSGFEIARDVRNEGLDTPILMLTARGEVADRVVGLGFGADDYLTKPFEFIELLARIEALLRRARRAHARKEVETAEYGDVRIDFRAAQVFRNSEPVLLSSKELQLLRFFVENEGVALTRDELLDAVWGYDSLTNTRTVDVHVGRLRQKLESEPNDPKLIVTVRGLGYRFERGE
jgi:DNA-binding response OmpR family regulator